MVKLNSFDRELVGADLMTRDGISLDVLYKLGIPVKENAPKGKRNCEDNYELILPLKYDAYPTNGEKWNSTIDSLLNMHSYRDIPPISLTHMYVDLSDFISRNALKDYLRHLRVCSRQPSYSNKTDIECATLDSFFDSLQNEVALTTCKMLQIDWRPHVCLLPNEHECRIVERAPVAPEGLDVRYTLDMPACKRYTCFKTNCLCYTGNASEDTLSLELKRLLLAARLVAKMPSLQAKGCKSDTRSRILDLTPDEIAVLPRVAWLNIPGYTSECKHCYWCQLFKYPCFSATYIEANNRVIAAINAVQGFYELWFMRPMPKKQCNSLAERIYELFRSLNELAIAFAEW